MSPLACPETIVSGGRDGADVSALTPERQSTFLAAPRESVSKKGQGLEMLSVDPKVKT